MKAPPHRETLSALELQIPDAEFVVCDVETTGLSPDKNRLTEIALRRVVNGSVVERYESLINPRQFVSHEITRLTGITNEMVYNAPEAGDVMEEVCAFIGGAVFVAHNARFDFSFVNATLRRCGMDELSVPVLCTSRLAHRLIPNRRKTGLGTLTRGLGININNRHRAAGDAEATALVLLHFLKLLQEEFRFTETGDIITFQNKPVFRITNPPKNVVALRPVLADVPHTSGVYFMHDRYGSIVYIGKAKDLHDRVNSYFYHNIGHTEKVKKLVRAVRTITWKTTETELSALLLESQSIKQHQPQFNSLLKGYRKYPFITISMQDEYPLIGWTYEMNDDGAEYFGPFSSRFAVEEALDSINKLFRLRECTDKIKPNPEASPCLYYEIKRCSAPCAALVSRDEYMQEVETLTLFLQGKHDELLDTFRARMQRKSDLLQFEEAALLRDRMAALERILRQQKVMARSVRKQNLVIITLARGTSVEMHLIKSGMLAHQVLLDQKHVKKTEIRHTIERVFATKQAEIFGTRKEDINEMRIIASWCLIRRDDSTVIESDAFEGLDTLVATVVATIERAGKPELEAMPTVRRALG